MKRLVAFDLDGTLAESKQPIGAEMAGLLARLSHCVDVCIISGGDWPQFQQQVVSQLPPETDLTRVWIMPATGTKLYQFGDGEWHQRYADLFEPAQRDQIIAELHAAIERLGLVPEQVWGEQIEDRGSQITFSALGQQAPVGPKHDWDPDREKRRRIQADLAPRLPDLSVRIGATSIDITKKGIDKAFGMERLAELSGIAKADMLFFGDALYPGGNDAPVRETAGIDSIQVYTVAETARGVEAAILCLSGPSRPTA